MAPLTRREFLKHGAITSAALSALAMGLAPEPAESAEPAAIISEAALRRLAARLKGDLILPTDPRYDRVRNVFNRAYDRYPAMIVRCASAPDVARSIHFARDNRLLVAVRGGGHDECAYSTCDGGMVVDLSPMTKIDVDAPRQHVHADGGVLVGNLDKATARHGLATALGECPDVGIAGSTLGGGQGYLLGKYGLSCDNVISARLVTADGELIAAAPGENEDLLWAIRGGGGNFGVITSFEYRLHTVQQVFGGVATWPISQARDVLRFWRDFTAKLPDELTTSCGFASANGRASVIVSACWCGEIEAGEKTMEPLQSFGHLASDTIKARPYVEMHSVMDFGSTPIADYERAGFLTEVNDRVIDVISANFEGAPLSYQVFLDHQHGAASRPPQDGNAYALRRDGYSMWIDGIWRNPGEAERTKRWVEEFWKAIRPLADGGVYVNALGEEGEERVKAAYGANYARLAEVKRKFDPDNFFRLNQNITPSPNGPTATMIRRHEIS